MEYDTLSCQIISYDYIYYRDISYTIVTWLLCDSKLEWNGNKATFSIICFYNIKIIILK